MALFHKSLVLLKCCYTISLKKPKVLLHCLPKHGNSAVQKLNIVFNIPELKTFVQVLLQHTSLHVYLEVKPIVFSDIYSQISVHNKEK